MKKTGKASSVNPSKDTKTSEKSSGSTKHKSSNKGDQGLSDDLSGDEHNLFDLESGGSTLDEADNDYRERIRKLREVRENASNKSGPNYVNVQASTIQFGRQVQVQKEQDKFKSEYVLRDLTTRSIIMFANRYMTYRTGLLAPASIQKCMEEDVKMHCKHHRKAENGTCTELIILKI